MKIMNKTIIFKSDLFFYFKELYGIKPNTARIINGYELKQFKREVLNLNAIEIINIDINESFKRELTDVSQFFGYDGDGEMFVFSWKNYQLIKD